MVPLSGRHPGETIVLVVGYVGELLVGSRFWWSRGIGEEEAGGEGGEGQSWEPVGDDEDGDSDGFLRIVAQPELAEVPDPFQLGHIGDIAGSGGE